MLVVNEEPAHRKKLKFLPGDTYLILVIPPWPNLTKIIKARLKFSTNWKDLRNTDSALSSV